MLSTYEFGDKAQDKEYKEGLIPYVLKSGGKVVVEATDRHGTRYEVRRIYGHAPDVYVAGELQPGVSIRETIINRPLYFGQKDLAAAGKGSATTWSRSSSVTGLIHTEKQSQKRRTNLNRLSRPSCRCRATQINWLA